MKFSFLQIKNTKKQTVFFSILFTLVLIGTSFGLKVHRAGALLGFGGQILSTTPCTCSSGAALAYVVVGPPFGGGYVQTEGTIMYDYTHTVYSPVGEWAGYTWLSTDPPGPWILGAYTATPAPICYLYVGEDCLPLDSVGAIVIAGTSMTSAPVGTAI